jgi:hypothetical protein
MKVNVKCYSGYKINERPISFSTHSREYKVLDIIDTWHGPDYAYFKLKADDNNIYILKCDERNNEWEITFFSKT